MTKNRISNELQQFLGTTNISPELENICRAIIDLQEARHDADYDVRYKITKSQTLTYLSSLDSAFENFEVLLNSSSNELNLFIILLLDAKIKIQ